MPFIRKKSVGVDMVIAADPADILKLCADPRIDRAFVGAGPIGNRLLVARLLRALSLRSRRFPTMLPRELKSRAEAQDALWNRLNSDAVELRSGPEELEPLARLVRGQEPLELCGRFAQQVVGPRFNRDFVATAATWDAALTLEIATKPITSRWTLLKWKLNGTLVRAQSLLGDAVNQDTAGVHAVGVAIHNFPTIFERMRAAYAAANGQGFGADDAGRRFLVAPAVVARQPTEDGVIAGCPMTRGTLVLMQLREAAKTNPEDMTFLSNTWSRCPADQWVPALVEGAWKRAIGASGAVW